VLKDRKVKRSAEPPKIFLDANILFSAAYGSPAMKRLWEKAKAGRCRLIASGYVVEEARRNLHTDQQQVRLSRCLSLVRMVPEADPGMPCPLDLPEKDVPVFMAAMTAKADYLVTGDLMHFGTHLGKMVYGVKICKVRDLEFQD
jgi:predicted nucleic acid-binding protein